MYKCSDIFDLSKLLDKFYIIIIYEISAQNIKILRVKLVEITKCEYSRYVLSKVSENSGEIWYKIYENLRSIEKILRKFDTNIR